MKKVKTLLALLLCTLYAAAQDKSLVITFSDNTKTEYALSTLPEISMANDKLSVTTASATAEFDLYKVKTFTFSSSTGISTLERQQFSLSGDVLVLPGENAQTRIFSIDGRAVGVEPIISQGKTMIDLGSLGRGIYVVSANGKSVKLTKK